MKTRSGLIAVLVIASFGAGGLVARADHDLEHRIAQFWARVDAMQPGDYLSSADLGQWALNVVERDPRARLTVADFRASTATMQAAIGRAGPAPVAATPAPTVRSVYKIGEKIRYTDGWALTVVKVEEYQSSNQFIKPKAGMRFVSVIVRFDNGSSQAQGSFSFNFELQDSSGIRRNPEYVGRDDGLTSTEIAPGAFAVGSLTFSAPIGDKALRLIYDDFDYAQTTFQLY